MFMQNRHAIWYVCGPLLVQQSIQKIYELENCPMNKKNRIPKYPMAWQSATKMNLNCVTSNVSHAWGVVFKVDLTILLFVLPKKLNIFRILIVVFHKYWHVF